MMLLSCEHQCTEECTSIPCSLNYVCLPYDQPPSSPITHQAPVDVMGVVVGVGALGSIKRKSDNSDVQRRDVTLVDFR